MKKKLVVKEVAKSPRVRVAWPDVCAWPPKSSVEDHFIAALGTPLTGWSIGAIATVAARKIGGMARPGIGKNQTEAAERAITLAFEALLRIFLIDSTEHLHIKAGEEASHIKLDTKVKERIYEGTLRGFAHTLRICYAHTNAEMEVVVRAFRDELTGDGDATWKSLQPLAIAPSQQTLRRSNERLVILPHHRARHALLRKRIERYLTLLYVQTEKDGGLRKQGTHMLREWVAVKMKRLPAKAVFPELPDQTVCVGILDRCAVQREWCTWE